MGKQILEISLILETWTKNVPLHCCQVEASASPTHSSHFIRMSWFHAIYLIHVGTIIHKLIKADWLLRGKKGERGGETNAESRNM